MRRVKRGKLVAVGLLMAMFTFTPHTALANTTASPNFEASEAQFGAGAALETCSGQYCAQASIGSIGGESSSENFTAGFSPLTEEDTEPMLEVFIEPGSSNLGKLDTNRTASRTMRLHVRSFLAGGYTVQITGDPPRYDEYSLATPIAPIASLTGTEQFAINVVANSTPEVGENPSFMPEEVLSDVVLPEYATSDMFTYRSGDIVAQTLSESSQIRYTVSMIVNVSGSTPAGHYSGDFNAVVTPVF